MAKRKTPKVKDLRPEKITDEQLAKMRQVVSAINKAQMDIGIVEVRKHEALHAITQMQTQIVELQNEFKEQYGTDDINIADGTIKYNDDNNEANKKDNNREGL